MKKIWKIIFSFVDDVLAYVLTLVCTLFASIIPLLDSSEELIIDLSLFRLIGSALVALLLTLWQEYNKPADEETKIKSKIGKRKHLVKRLVFSMIFGFASPTIMEKLITIVNIG